MNPTDFIKGHWILFDSSVGFFRTHLLHVHNLFIIQLDAFKFTHLFALRETSVVLKTGYLDFNLLHYQNRNLFYLRSCLR